MTPSDNDAEFHDHDDDLDDIPDIQYPNEPRNLVQTGEEVNLTNKDHALNQIMIGVGWDLKGFDKNPPDLDASIFLLDRYDRTREDTDFIFYNSLTGCDGAVKHLGDSRTGAGDGDDEMILVELNALPFDIMKIVVVLSIYNLGFDDHDFSMVRNVYFRLVNKNMDHELLRYELDEDLGTEEGLIIGQIERIGAEWIFTAMGKPVEGGLGKIADDYGMVILENMM